MKRLMLILSVAGLAFSGYISSIKMFSQVCAFGESCPNFLGYPACYYGFVFFLALTVLSWRLFTEKGDEGKNILAGATVALIGTFFAGYMTSLEIPLWYSLHFAPYAFGLPTCAWGFIFYVLLLALYGTVFVKQQKNRSSEATSTF